MSRVLVMFILALVLPSCSSFAPNLTPGSGRNTIPLVWERGTPPVEWTFTTVANAGATLWPVADHNNTIWFGVLIWDETHTGFYVYVDEVNMSGTIVKRVLLSSPGSAPTNVPNKIVVGNDDSVWVAAENVVFAVSGPAGGTSYYSNNQSVPDVTPGGSSDLYFTTCCIGNYVVHATNPTTPLHYYRIPDQRDRVQNLVVGADKNVWFTLQHHTDRSWWMSRLVPSTSVVSEFRFPQECNPGGQIVEGPDGRVWFGSGQYICRVNTLGSFQSFKLPGTGAEGHLAVGPDKNIWVSLQGSPQGFTVLSTSGSLVGTHVCSPSLCPNSGSGTLIGGPDENVWFTENGGLGIFVRLAMNVSPASLTFARSGVSQTVNVSEANYTGTWSASSTNTNVARVDGWFSSRIVNITAVAPGSCRIIVRDAHLNYYSIPVFVH